MGVDVTGNSSGSFAGQGNEIVFRNDHIFKTPNAANNNYLTPMRFGRASGVEGAVNFPQGILFGSDQADSNTLQDYEEGTYTPYFGASGNYNSGGMVLNYTTQYGAYVKIGHIVVVSISLTWDSKSGTNSSNSSDLTLSMPFNCGNGNFMGQGTIGYNNAVDFNADARGIHGASSINIIYFDRVQTGSGKHAGYVSTSNIASSGHFRLGYTYMTTA